MILLYMPYKDIYCLSLGKTRLGYQTLMPTGILATAYSDNVKDKVL